MNDRRGREFELSPMGQPAKWFFAIAAMLPAVVVMTIWLLDEKAFIGLPGWFFPLVLCIGPVIMAAGALGAVNPKANLGPDGLKIHVSFINKTWPLSTMDRQAACIVNLENRKELRPKWKLWGAAMPGLSSGLFKLYNGEKSYLYITDRQKVVYVPTQSGPVLLSLERPGDFLAALQGLPC